MNVPAYMGQGSLLSAHCCHSNVQPEVGSPIPFREFLFTASTTPLPVGTVVLVASQRDGATGKAVLGCLAQ